MTPTDLSDPRVQNTNPARPPTTIPPLRVWPALVLVAAMLLMRFGPGLSEDWRSKYWIAIVFGPMLCSLLLLIGWPVASRATRKERWLGLLGILGVVFITVMLADPTMRGPGTMHVTAPMGMVAFVIAASLLRRQPPFRRTGVALLAALVGCSFSLLLRNEGMSGSFTLGLHWRWTASPEARMLASPKTESAERVIRPDANAMERAIANPEWPGFRGADRASRQQGPSLATDWTSAPPRRLWKVAMGPAWSSFAVAGDFLFTQEQRGPKELVVCLRADTGQEIWSQAIEARFDEPLGGPGPRATPTLAEGGVFVTGATGTLMRLNPETGAIVWKQELQMVAGRKPPMWGFAASPLVTGGVAIVYAGGAADKGVLAFDAASGKLRWSAAAGNDSYGSPQLSTIAGEKGVLMLTNEGLHVFDATTGATRMNYEWKFGGYRALQPHLIGDDVVLLPTGMSTGTRAIRITRSAGGQLAAEELWTSRSLKPDFNDFVTYQGHAYGFDGGIFGCVDLRTGERKWKGGRYGKGQVLLLESSGLLLVASEQGQAVLLRADPNQHVELTSFSALEGKTWNHPVVVGNRLYLRNSQEAAGYELPLAAGAEKAPR